jgi:hypothetical protein
MKQLHVFVPNEPGQFARITEALAAAGVNIDDFDVETHGADGIIVLAVDNTDDALRALRDAGLRAVTQDTLLIRLEDKPGALATVAARLRDAGLDLRSLHIIRRSATVSIASLVADDNVRAAAVLRDILLSPPAGG